jgi:hypothetical protein
MDTLTLEADTAIRILPEENQAYETINSKQFMEINKQTKPKNETH